MCHLYQHQMDMRLIDTRTWVSSGWLNRQHGVQLGHTFVLLGATGQFLRLVSAGRARSPLASGLKVSISSLLSVESRRWRAVKELRTPLGSRVRGNHSLWSPLDPAPLLCLMMLHNFWSVQSQYGFDPLSICCSWMQKHDRKGWWWTGGLECVCNDGEEVPPQSLTAWVLLWGVRQCCCWKIDSVCNDKGACFLLPLIHGTSYDIRTIIHQLFL